VSKLGFCGFFPYYCRLKSAEKFSAPEGSPNDKKADRPVGAERLNVIYEK